tara:strand:- start:362 stop:574 length:213 start_codon:yes stop_codon:yes gene_type:complete
MIKWNNIEILFNSKKQNLWKNKLKIGVLFLLFGYLIFALKELIIGLISLIFFIVGGYLILNAFSIWKDNN